MKKKILITGAAGFIGFYLGKSLLDEGQIVIGFDNINDYYDTKLKHARLAILKGYDHFSFVKGDLADQKAVEQLFQEYKPEIVVNLAAQAGVRYSIENPQAYVNANLVGFFHLLEACRHEPVKHLIYASSSSVYGANQKVPFSVEDQVDRPISLYAATKKSNELMAHCYSKLYDIPSTGLRFFTVYGPMGRPDMAYFSFTQKIINGEPIQIFNHGDMYRDFTYIDDIVQGIKSVMERPPIPNEDGVKYKIYNIGNNKPVKLMDFIMCLEKALSKAYGREFSAKKEFLPMQQGDVLRTYADVSELMADFNFKPDTPIQEGLDRFAEWYRSFYGSCKGEYV